MRYVLRITHLGEGTVLQKALFQALDDINEMEHLSGAEILIITDGAVSLDEDAIRSKMDENIEVHTVKIGHAQVIASEAQIADMIARGQVKDRTLIELQKQKFDIQSQLRVAEGTARRQSLEQMLNGIRAQFAAHKVPFGHELERISNVYINIDDFNETERFRADHETLDDLEALAHALEEEAKEFLTPELTKKLAVLHDHIQFLQRFETDESLRERLKNIDEHLRGLLSQFLGTANESDSNAAETGMQPTRMPMSEDDTRDMRFLLEADLSLSKNWGVLLKWMWEMAKQLRRKLKKS